MRERDALEPARQGLARILAHPERRRAGRHDVHGEPEAYAGIPE